MPRKKVTISGAKAAKIKKVHGNIIDNIKFWKHQEKLSRQEARKQARLAREQGYKARVISGGKGYSLYIDQRPRSYGLVPKQDRRV